jgi:transposase
VDRQLWVGVDLGSEVHQVCVMDSHRTVLLDRKVANKGAAILDLVAELLTLTNQEARGLLAAVETPNSSLVEMLLERGVRVFTINPKQVDRFRDRYSTAGAKDDRRDALVLADSLRTDGHCYREVKLGDATFVQLRELSRMHDELITEENGLANRIDAELIRCFPELRELGAVHTDAWMLELIDLAPTPQRARRVPLGKIRGILQRGRVRRWTPEHVLAILRGPSVHVAPGVAEAAAHHISFLSPRLKLVREQKRTCVRSMQTLLDQLSEPVSESERIKHRDASILRSLPGVGTIVCATMLAEAWEPLADRDYTRLRTICGSAPVTKRSGKKSVVVMRRACNPRLRQALYHWARCSLQHNERTKAHYARLRACGHSHGRALRGVADRLLDLLVRLLVKGEPYDPARQGVLSAA